MKFLRPVIVAPFENSDLTGYHGNHYSSGFSPKMMVRLPPLDGSTARKGA